MFFVNISKGVFIELKWLLREQFSAKDFIFHNSYLDDKVSNKILVFLQIFSKKVFLQENIFSAEKFYQQEKRNL